MVVATINNPIATSSFSDGVNGFNELDSPRSLTITTINGRDYALVHAYGDHGVQIVDITDLSNPTPVAAIEDGVTYTQLERARNSAITHFEGNTYALITSYGTNNDPSEYPPPHFQDYEDAGIQIVNISDPSNPLPAGTIENGELYQLRGANSITTRTANGKTYALVTSTVDDCLQIINITDLANPFLAKSITKDDDGYSKLVSPRGLTTVEIEGSTYAITASSTEDTVHIININDPENPSLASFISDDENLVLNSPRNVSTFLIGDRTYALVAAKSDDGVQIIDISNPSAPTATANFVQDGNDSQSGTFDLLDSIRHISTVEINNRHYALTASKTDDLDNGVSIVDISDPSDPVAVFKIKDGDLDSQDNQFNELSGPYFIEPYMKNGNIYALVVSRNDDGVQIIELQSAPAVTSATYKVSSGVLAVTGSNFVVNSGSTNDIDISKLTITGEGGNTYSLTSNDIELTSATAFSVTLNSADQLQLAGLLNKNGNTSGGGTTYNLAAASSWNPGASSSPADSTGNEITVSNVAAPNLSSASYDDSTGVLALTGSSLPAYPGSSNDIDVSKLTITGESGGTYTLSSSDVELTSATEFIVTLNSTDQTNLDSILNKNGTSSSQGTTYNIAAADRWAPGSDLSVNSADLTGNAVTVTNIPNRAPSGSVTISGTATQGETLTAANTLVDLDGLGSIGYQWNRAGAEISGATSSTYLLGRADVGSTITVTANYTDGEEKAESVTSISATPMVASHIYHLSSDTINGIANSGILITNKRGQTFSDTSSYRWDAVKAVQDGSNQWKVLLRGDNSHDGKWYCWNVDETGVITSGSGWKNTADAINAGWDSIFGNSLSPNTDTSLSVLDVNANGIVDDITNYHLTNGSNSVRLHSTDLQSYSHESSANWDVSKAVEINGAWKVLVKGANSMDGMWSVWDAGVSGTVTQASTWMSTADSLKEGWEQIFGNVIQVDNVIGPVEYRNDSNSDGLMDNMVIYHLDSGENGDGIAIHNSRGNTYSDASTSRWDAVLAVEDNNNDWKVLLQGTGSYDGKWYYWNVDDTGLITSGSGWKSYQGAIDDGWQSFFGNDLKGFNNNQLIIEVPNVITS